MLFSYFVFGVVKLCVCRGKEDREGERESSTEEKWASQEQEAQEEKRKKRLKNITQVKECDYIRFADGRELL